VQASFTPILQSIGYIKSGRLRALAVTGATRSESLPLGAEPMLMTPSEFGKYMIAETEKWGRVVKTAGIKVN
jgi:tripartite-type tricarboxylate transporter receptor subunit TctC